MAEVLLITALVLGLFYFLFIRPTRREQASRQRDLNALRVGDRVLTRAGFLARVAGVETPADGPMLLSLELADGVVVQARTEAIAELLSPEEAEAAEDADDEDYDDGPYDDDDDYDDEAEYEDDEDDDWDDDALDSGAAGDSGRDADRGDGDPPRAAAG